MKDEIWSGSALVSPRAITAPSTSTTQIDTDLTDTSRPTYWDMVALLVGLRFLRPGYWTSFATGERPPQTHHVNRYDAEGPAGVRDRPLPARPPALSEAELVLLFDRVFRGPDPETDGVSAWTLPDLCRWIEARFDKRLTPQSLSRILRREGFSRQKTRPTHPKTDEAARRRFEEGGSARRWRAPPQRIPASG